MTLPAGFQSRPCLFCGSRNHMNSPQPDGQWKVSCIYCEASGPVAHDADSAWLAWNGLCPKAPGVSSAVAEVF